MKYLLFLLFATTLILTTNAQTSIYDYSFTDIEGNERSLSEFKGKKMLLINTASECGYTGQYEGLQKLHELYGKDVVLIGFPCDQFGGQEPGSDKDIKSFCMKNYGVDFLMASKIEVKGDGQHDIYTWLTSKELNGKDNCSIAWNFEKFVIDENGNWVAHFKSPVKPMDEAITELLK